MPLAVEGGDKIVRLRWQSIFLKQQRAPWRGIAHCGFLLAAKLLLGLHCEDPQCGAKVIRGADYRRIAHRLVENGLAFDSELLATLARDGSRWREVPVTWIEKKGGKVKPLRDAWGMFGALMSVRSRME